MTTKERIALMLWCQDAIFAWNLHETMLQIRQLEILEKSKLKKMSSVYSINKGINKPVEFKGLKAQYIWYLGGGLVILLVVFAILYICGINPFLCLFIIGISGTCLFMYIYRLSRTYGEYGLMKKMARKGIPKVIKNYSDDRLRKKLSK